MSRAIIPFILFSLLAIMLYFGLDGTPVKTKSFVVDKPAPLIDIVALDGKTKLDSDTFKGHWVAINFWAEWCSQCRVEMPYLERLSKQTEIKLYGVNYLDKHQSALSFLARYGNPYIASGFDQDGLVGVDWGVTAVPETFLIDPKGIVRYRHIGPVNQYVINHFLSIIKKSKLPSKPKVNNKDLKNQSLPLSINKELVK